MKKFELRECSKPSYLKAAKAVEGIKINGTCYRDQYNSAYYCISDGNNDIWKMVWSYAFHTTTGRRGSRTSEWCWKPLYHVY